jgi:type I restriction enzyme S subunit
VIRRWREIERWIEDTQTGHTTSFAEHQLSEVITRRVSAINRDVRAIEKLNVIAKITFGGELHVRNDEEKRGYKGPLFEALPDDLVISKIRVAQGSLCVVPNTLDHLAVSAEYPVYEVDRAKVHVQYLRLVVRTTVFQNRISRLRSGNTTKARIRPAQFEALPIPLPSLAEQDALISAYSDALNRAAQLEQEADALERAGWQAFEAALGVAPPPPLPDRPVFVARFKDVERWSHEGVLRNSAGRETHRYSCPLIRLGDLVADLENGWSPKCHSHPAREGKWGVLKLGAVSFGVFDAHENKELPANLKPRAEHEVNTGDVLISRANVVRYVGACVYVDETPPHLLLCDKIFRVRFRSNGQLLPRFLTEAMKLRMVREHIESRLTGTSPTMKNISKPSLLDIVLPVPHPVEQQRLVDIVEAARSQAAAMRTEAATLRQSAWAAFEATLFTHAKASAA